MMYRMKLFFLFSLLGNICFAQQLDKAKLDEYFNTLDTHEKFMGTVAVSMDGEVVYTRSIGYSDIEKKIKNDENTRYRIGSVSKVFTTVLVMQAVEAGKLSLDQKLSDFYPAINNAANISIRDLLLHRSGIHNFTENTDYLSWYRQPKSETEMMDIIIKGGSDFPAGTKHSYSNTNYVILTYILQKVFNLTYSEMLQSKILKPLKLKNTYFDILPGLQDDEANSYRYIQSWEKQNDTHMSVPMGAGGIVSTADDLIKFGDGLFSYKLISKESVEQMKTMVNHYGLGLFMVPFDEKRGFGHTGGIDGFNGYLFYFPDDKLSFALLSNGSRFSNNDIAIAVMSAVFGREYEIPNLVTHTFAPGELKKFEGTYSNPELPIKITITQHESRLIAQGTGQPAFPLDATGPTSFQFITAGVKIEFDQEAKSLLLKQAGQEITFTKE